MKGIETHDLGFHGLDELKKSFDQGNFIFDDPDPCGFKIFFDLEGITSVRNVKNFFRKNQQPRIAGGEFGEIGNIDIPIHQVGIDCMMSELGNKLFNPLIHEVSHKCYAFTGAGRESIIPLTNA